MITILLQLEAVKKSIAGRVLFQNISLSCDMGEMIFIVGESGCGKTTLLHMLAGYDQDYQGKITFGNLDLRTSNKQQKTKASRMIGMIFQHLYLIPYYKNRDNIALFKSLHQQDLEEIVNHLHIEKILDSYPAKTSGGEQQRVAIARTLIHQPLMILADEPTGSLDETNSEIVFDLLQKQSKKSLVIVVTHNRIFAEKYATTLIDLATGTIEKKQEAVPHSNEVLGGVGSMNFKTFIIHQFLHYYKQLHTFLLPGFIAILTYCLILGGLSVYRRFVQNLNYQQSLRIDQDYLTFYLAQEERDNASLYVNIEAHGGLEIKPYHSFLNQGLITYLYYYQNNPFFKSFYFEITPVIGLETDMAINQLFYEECHQKIDKLFMRFKNQDITTNIVSEIHHVIDDGTLYNTPRIFIDYDYCLLQWPSIPFVDNRRYFHFPSGSVNMKQYLFKQNRISAYYQGLLQNEDGVMYDYSSYLLYHMMHDLSNSGRVAMSAIIALLMIAIASLQSLLFAYLARRRYREAILLRSHGASTYIYNYVLLHDLIWTNIFSFVIAFCLYLLLLYMLPQYVVFSLLACSIGIVILFINITLTSLLMLYKINRGMMRTLIQEQQQC